ncbi:MAG: hypothetical protein AAF171_12740 [Cyanobacteria bacterium P01_A01_bin.116]
MTINNASEDNAYPTVLLKVLFQSALLKSSFNVHRRQVAIAG